MRREIVARDQMDRAVALERAGEATWLEHLVLENVIDEELVAELLSRESMVPRCAPKMLEHIPQQVIDRVPPEIAFEHRLVPLHLDDDGYLHVAMVDPVDDAAVEEASFFAGNRVMRVVAAASTVAWALHRYYGLRSRLWPRTA